MKEIIKVIGILIMFCFVCLGLYWNFLREAEQSTTAIVIVSMCALPTWMIWSIFR